MKSNDQVILDFIKGKIYDIYRALESIKEATNVDFVITCVSCYLKVVFISDQSKLFRGEDSLNEVLKYLRCKF